MESYSALARDTLRTADLRFAQVERVYSDRGSLRLHSGGGQSRVKPALASVFADCGFDVESVASNHAMDWRPEAMLNSINLLRGKGIATVGAGHNLDEARKPAFVERDGIRIAFLAYCTVLRDGYTAEKNKPGVSPLRAHTYYQAFDYQARVPPRTVHSRLPDNLRVYYACMQHLLRRSPAPAFNHGEVGHRRRGLRINLSTARRQIFERNPVLFSQVP